MPKGRQHRLQLRGWQALVVLAARAEESLASDILPELFAQLRVPHVPDVRDYQEILACALSARFEERVVEPLLLPALKDFDAPIQTSASILTIASFLLQRWSMDAAKAVTSTRSGVVACAVAPYLSHNTPHVRSMAAFGLYHFFEGQARAPTSTSIGLEPGAAVLLGEMGRFLATDAKSATMRERLKPIFQRFDPEACASLECILERSRIRPTPLSGRAFSASHAVVDEGSTEDNLRHVFIDGEFQPTNTLLESIKTEVNQLTELPAERDDPSSYPSCATEWRSRLATLQGAGSLGAPTGGTGGDDGKFDPPAVGVALACAGAGAQRKFAPAAPPAERDSSSAQVISTRVPLVVVASLVDIPANLAGLSRTSEIFNCEVLCFSSKSIVKDPAFQTISVGAEKWLPILELPRISLRGKLMEWRQRGYVLVGLEQTHDSTSIEAWPFARRTVLVLGNEKAGIDADILPLLDGCVEIPQSGQLRSLNVHASGSIAIWEYTRQQLGCS